MLRPGGCLRVVVQDAALVMQRYFDAPDALVADSSPDVGATPMETVNMHFRPRYEHQFPYDWDTLCSIGCPDLVLDEDKYAWEGLYAGARTCPGAGSS